MNKINEKLKFLFSEIGIHIIDEDYDQELNLDSLQLVMILIKIQTTFLIDTFENNQLDYSSLRTFNDFLNMICIEIREDSSM